MFTPVTVRISLLPRYFHILLVSYQRKFTKAWRNSVSSNYFRQVWQSLKQPNLSGSLWSVECSRMQSVFTICKMWLHKLQSSGVCTQSSTGLGGCHWNNKIMLRTPHIVSSVTSRLCWGQGDDISAQIDLKEFVKRCREDHRTHNTHICIPLLALNQWKTDSFNTWHGNLFHSRTLSNIYNQIA